MRRSNQLVLKEINPEYSLEGQNTEAGAPVLWPPDVKSQLIGKDPEAGEDRGQKEKVDNRERWLDGTSTQ